MFAGRPSGEELLEHSVREEGGKHEEKEYWLHGEVGSGLVQFTPCSGERTHDDIRRSCWLVVTPTIFLNNAHQRTEVTTNKLINPGLSPPKDL